MSAEIGVWPDAIEVKIADLIHCPRCGTELKKENFHSTIDPHLDEEYRWVKCEECDWQEEG